MIKRKVSAVFSVSFFQFVIVTMATGLAESYWAVCLVTNITDSDIICFLGATSDYREKKKRAQNKAVTQLGEGPENP